MTAVGCIWFNNLSYLGVNMATDSQGYGVFRVVVIAYTPTARELKFHYIRSCY